MKWWQSVEPSSSGYEVSGFLKHHSWGIRSPRALYKVSASQPFLPLSSLPLSCSATGSSMDRSLLCSTVMVVLLAVMIVSHASLPAQVYWQTKLPNTPMPAAIRELLLPDLVDGKTKAGVRWKVDHSSDQASRAANARSHVWSLPADRLLDDPDMALYLLQKDLHPGSKMKLYFSKPQPGPTFLPRLVADSIPFSSSQTPAIFQKFSINPKSREAEAMKDTLKMCELPAKNSEQLLCATSLESMVEFATAKLGTHMKILTTTSSSDEKDSLRQEYTIGAGIQEMAGTRSVSCHNQIYPYAVFFCHETEDTAVYMVPLVGKDGTKVEAVVVCHKDTSLWNPNHLAFQVLKVKPGTVPICHHFPRDHIVWVPSR